MIIFVNYLIQAKDFVQKVYLNDVIVISCFYKDWFKIGGDVPNYLAVPDMPLDTKGTKFDLLGGTIFNRDFRTLHQLRALMIHTSEIM